MMTSLYTSLYSSYMSKIKRQFNKKPAIGNGRSLVYTQFNERHFVDFNDMTELVEEHDMGDFCRPSAARDHGCLVHSVSTHEYARKPFAFLSTQSDSAVASIVLIILTTRFSQIDPPSYFTNAIGTGTRSEIRHPCLIS